MSSSRHLGYLAVVLVFGACVPDGERHTSSLQPAVAGSLAQRVSAAVPIDPGDVGRVCIPGFEADLSSGGLDLCAAGKNEWSYRLASVRRGAALVCNFGDVIPVAAQGFVGYRRDGGIVEVYESRGIAIEQSFLLPAPLPGEGDVVISGNVSTSLVPVSVGNELHYRSGDGHTRLRYGAVTVLDALGKSIVVAAEQGVGRIDIRVPGAWLDDATYPVVVDPLVGGNFAVGQTAGHDSEPSVAYNPQLREYFVVWTFTELRFNPLFRVQDVFGQRLSEDGTPIGGPIPIRTSLLQEWGARVAYSETSRRYFVAMKAEEFTTSGFRPRHVIGTILKEDGSVAVPGFYIMEGTSPEFSAGAADDVVWNAARDEFLVVSSWRVGTTIDLYGEVVRASNGAIVRNDVVLRGVHSGGVGNADLVYRVGADAYWMVYESFDGGVFGFGIDGGVTSMTTPVVRISPAAFSGRSSIAWNQARDEGLVVFDSRDPDFSFWIRGQRVASNGALVNSGFNLTDVNERGTFLGESTAEVAFSPERGQYFVPFEVTNSDSDLDIRGRAVSADGTRIGAPLAISASPNTTSTEEQPALAYARASREWLVCWADGRSLSRFDIFGQRVAPVILDNTPPSVTISAPAPDGVFVNVASITPVFSAQDEAGGSGIASVTGVLDGTTSLQSGVPFDASGLALGTHVLAVMASDNAGNSATSGVTFYLERFSVFPGPANPASARTPAGSRGVTLLQFRLDRRGSPVAGMLGAISLLASGSGDDSRLARVLLVRDLDSNGIAGAADPVLASGRFASNDGTLVLSGFSAALPANGTADFVVACDLSGDERYLDTFAVTLANAVAGIQARVVEPLGLPLAGREVDVDDVTPPVVDIQSPPDASSLPDIGQLTISFTAQDEQRGSGIATIQANLDGNPVTSGQSVQLGTLAVGEHRVTVTASDVAGNRTTAVSVFRTVTPQQALQDVADGVQAVIADPGTPAAARPLLQDAIDLLVGNNGGRSANGAITLMNNGDVVAAMVKIQQAIRKLRQAADRGAATRELQEKLAEFLGQTMSARVAHLEGLVAANPNVDPTGKMPQIRSFMSQGDSAFAAGNYESAVLYYRQAEQRVLELDREPAVVTFLEPPGLVTNDTTPRIRVQYIDLLGLIRTAGVHLFLDGVERTGIAQVGPFQVILDVPNSLALSEGAHLVRIQVPDSAGNVADVTRTLLVDVTPPTVTFDSPAAFALLRNGSFLLQARYADNLSGMETRTAQVLVNGVDLTAFAQVSDSGVQLNVQGNLALPDGPASTEVSVRDRAGNVGSASLQFLVDSAAPVVTIMPRSFTTITGFPVTFSMDVQDSGSGLLDAPAAVKFNGTDITGRFSAQVLNRVQVLNEMNVAREVVLTYTPSADEFTALVRASGIGVLFMEVNAQDRAQNGTRVQGYYEVNLGGGGGGGGAIAPIIVLRDARTPQFPPPPLPVTNRCGPALNFKVRALDLARGQAPVPGVALDFESPEGWGQFVHSKELGPLTTVTGADGLAGSGMIAGSTPGVHPVTVSVFGDPSVTALQFNAEATEPSLDPIVDGLQVEPGSCVNAGILVQAWAARPSSALVNETVRIVMVDASGQETPVDESKFLIMPSEELTTGGGFAHFELVALSGTQPGPYNFRARLSEWNISTDFPIRVLDPRAHLTLLPTPPDGSVTNRNIYLAVVSGSAQIGVHDATLQRDFVVQLMKDGAASGPISESYPCFENGIRVFPDREMHIRKVRFGASENATLSQPNPSLPDFSDVDLDVSGQARVTLTCGPSTAPIEVRAFIIEEAGLPPNLQDEVLESNATAPIFAVGTPDVRLERKTANGAFVPAPAVFMAGPDYAWQYRWVLHLPADDSRGTVPGRVVSRDACGDDIAQDLTRSHPVTTVLDLTPTQTQPAPDRYKQYASAEWAALTDRSGERAKTSFPAIDPEPDTGDPTLNEPLPDPSPPPVPTVSADDAGWIALRIALSDEQDYVKAHGAEPLAFMDVTMSGGTVTQASVLKSTDFTFLAPSHPLAVRVILPAVKIPIPVRVSLSGATLDIPPLSEGDTPWTPNLNTEDLQEYHRVFTPAELNALGLLSRTDDDVRHAICIYDMVGNFTDPNTGIAHVGSNWKDGDAVDTWATDHGFRVAGHARSEVSADRQAVATPSRLGRKYLAARSKFIRSAGVALLLLQAPDHLLGPVYRGVSWQAGIFYYSGHGLHDLRQFWLVAADDRTLDIDALAAACVTS